MNREVLEEALEVFSPEAQLLKAAEEACEFAVECHHYADGRQNLEALAEEMADLHIMTEQVMLIIGPEGHAAFARQLDRKHRRLCQRLNRPEPAPVLASTGTGNYWVFDVGVILIVLVLVTHLAGFL